MNLSKNFVPALIFLNGVDERYDEDESVLVGPGKWRWISGWAEFSLSLLYEEVEAGDILFRPLFECLVPPSVEDRKAGGKLH